MRGLGEGVRTRDKMDETNTSLAREITIVNSRSRNYRFSAHISQIAI